MFGCCKLLFPRVALSSPLRKSGNYDYFAKSVPGNNSDGCYIGKCGNNSDDAVNCDTNNALFDLMMLSFNWSSSGKGDVQKDQQKYEHQNEDTEKIPSIPQNTMYPPSATLRNVPLDLFRGNTGEQQKYEHQNEDTEKIPSIPQNTKYSPSATLRNVPSDLFRGNTGERLGCEETASICGPYYNPEFFSSHNMIYYDMEMVLRHYKNSCPPTNRKPVIF